MPDSNLGSMIFCLSRHCKNEDTYFLVSISPVPAHFAVHEPTQVRLALTGVPTQMRVMWVNEKCPGKPLGGAGITLFTFLTSTNVQILTPLALRASCPVGRGVLQQTIGTHVPL